LNVDTRPRIAVDAMGGDHAPVEIVAGTILASHDGLGRMVLVGDRRKIEPLLVGPGSEDIEVVHTEDVVAMDAHASYAVRNASGTSLGEAVDLVRSGEADACVSAGNSGAFLAIALIRLRTIAGIARPAIATVIPASHGPVVLLDAGANVDCRPEWLVQFAIMGSAYSRAALGIAEPRVGIISVGEERSKGNSQSIAAAELLDTAPVNFIGNVEGKDLFANHADVIVTDGFIGNVMLKLTEGAGTYFRTSLRETIEGGSPLGKLGALLLRPAFAKLQKKLSYDTYGGAPLLGLRGNCIVAHGRSNRTAIRNAIAAAAAESRADLIKEIAASVERVPA